jgi:excisionase family DNA binding protein
LLQLSPERAAEAHADLVCLLLGRFLARSANLRHSDHFLNVFALQKHTKILPRIEADVYSFCRRASAQKATRRSLMEKIAFSPDEVAEATETDVKVVRKSIQDGTIPHFRMGRLIKIPAWWVRQQLNGPGKAA